VASFAQDKILKQAVKGTDLKYPNNGNERDVDPLQTVCCYIPVDETSCGPFAEA